MDLPLFIASVLLLNIVYCVTISLADNNEGDRNELIQEAAMSFLGVKEPFETETQSKRRLPSPPRYMLDLYDSYKAGNTQNQGNTVRSILPMKGKKEGVEILIFNLTGIHVEEKILEAKLHIFKRRRPKGARRRGSSTYRLKISDFHGQIQPHFVNLVTRQKHGWYSYNITQSVKQCRSLVGRRDYLLVATIEVRRRNGRYRSVTLRRITRLNSQPFLIIFSEDQNNTSKMDNIKSVDTSYGEIEELLRIKGMKTQSTILRRERSLPNFLLESRRDNLPGIKPSIEAFPRTGMILSNITEDRLRYKRSVLSNEVIDESEEDELPDHNEVAIKYSKKIDPHLVPLYKTPPPRRRNKVRRRDRKLPVWWVQYQGKHRAHNLDRVCQKRKLVIDFAKIGWNEWVISPESFDAYYCTGRCSFPLIKNGRPSNHATIQSLVHALNKNVQVPAPCCVPSSTSSLTLLYFDQDRNVVLKNYPGMIVQSCACR